MLIITPSVAVYSDIMNIIYQDDSSIYYLRKWISSGKYVDFTGTCTSKIKLDNYINLRTQSQTFIVVKFLV